jgi:pyruvate ferredoxin oxidoreductase gamma subunit
MIEIIFSGRGGQGAVTASELLAVAAFKDGKFSQAFPKFGPERRGAPVEAYTRINDKFINLRSQVYKPDYVVVLDSRLGVPNDCITIVNSEEPKGDYSVDASKIAMNVLGVPIVNTAMLGAFAKATGLVSINSLEVAIADKLDDKNVGAMKLAYEQTKKVK